MTALPSHADIVGLSGGPVRCRVLRVFKAAAHLFAAEVEVVEPHPAYDVGQVKTYAVGCVAPVGHPGWTIQDWHDLARLDPVTAAADEAIPS